MEEVQVPDIVDQVMVVIQDTEDPILVMVEVNPAVDKMVEVAEWVWDQVMVIRAGMVKEMIGMNHQEDMAIQKAIGEAAVMKVAAEWEDHPVAMVFHPMNILEEVVDNHAVSMKIQIQVEVDADEAAAATVQAEDLRAAAGAVAATARIGN